jgi:hypothetical protein
MYKNQDKEFSNQICYSHKDAQTQGSLSQRTYSQQGL